MFVDHVESRPHFLGNDPCRPRRPTTTIYRERPKAIHAERIPVPPHLAEAQRVVIRNALAAQPQEGE
jgi:hypothetical protein